MGSRSILDFHLTSPLFPNIVVRHICASQWAKFLLVTVSHICTFLRFLWPFLRIQHGFIAEKRKKKESEIKKQDSIAASLETHVKLRDLKKISVVGNDWLIMNVGNIWLIFVGVEHQLGHRPVFFSSC